MKHQTRRGETLKNGCQPHYGSWNFFFLSTSSPWYALSQILNDWGNSFDDFVFVLLQSFLEVFALFKMNRPPKCIAENMSFNDIDIFGCEV